MRWLRALTTAPILFAALFAATTIGYMAPPNTGAIFTTDVSCSGTNINIFLTKDDVYVDGGPAHEGAAGLADGVYYIQVT